MISSPQWALLSGIILSFFLQNSKIQNFSKRAGTISLQLSVILLGASLNFSSVIHQGQTGLTITFLSILLVFLLGALGIKYFKLNHDQGILITMGTAICGGSAISALAPVIRADSMAITVSIAIVFLLNSLAIFIFPIIGELIPLSQEQFGLWSALSIHDTSSVVAAASIYGTRALEVATIYKLTRALWIIPITLIFSLLQNKNGNKKFSVPWFIFGFLILSLFFTYSDISDSVRFKMSSLSKFGFSITLFFIGIGLDYNRIKKIGHRPLIFAILLWLAISVISLVAISKNLL